MYSLAVLARVARGRGDDEGAGGLWRAIEAEEERFGALRALGFAIWNATALNKNQV